jgi:hypothetical protein
MGLILGPLLDPGLEEGFLLGGEWFVRCRGRHEAVNVVRQNAADQLTRSGLARYHGSFARVGWLGRRFSDVQPQSGLAGPFVGTMTFKAVGRQDRTNLAVEVDRLSPANDSTEGT